MSSLQNGPVDVKEHIPAPIDLPEVQNYVSHMISATKPRPDITWQNFYGELNWFNVILLAFIPAMGIIGAYHTPLRWETALFSVFYYFYTGLGGAQRFHNSVFDLLTESSQGSQRGTTVSGPTAATTRASFSNTFLLLLGPAQCKAPSNGGRGAIALITDTPTQNLTRIMPRRASGTRTWAGCS
jgi:hypothetical protein